MKAKRAWILKTNHEKSNIYAKDVADSCDRVGMPWEYLNWYQRDPDSAWKNTGIPPLGEGKISGNPGAQCCFSGHIAIWKKILDSGEAGIALEHDGMLLHKPEIDIPDGILVVLGYKFEDISRYDHVAAGPPNNIVDVMGGGHEGSHAYAITPKTAGMLIEEVQNNGAKGAIDNLYFLKSRKTKVPIKIMVPTPAIGWIRESTIQAKNKSATRNYDFVENFKKYYV